MNMLEIDRLFYETYAKDAIADAFPEYAGRIAAGLVGAGSECFGFDDETSRDHDVFVGFQLFLTDGDEEKIGFSLSALYDRLPRDFMGVAAERRSRMGDGKLGVKRISDFYRQFTGSSGAPQSWRQWMALPSYALAQAVNGEVFADPLGEFSRIRAEIANGMPRDVRLKKIAARCALMAQSGQYNYSRCLSHGEEGAALLALAEFVRNAAELAFLLEGKHMPFYKWALRAMRALPGYAPIEKQLAALLKGECDREKTIEDVSAQYIEKLRALGLTDGGWDFLEPHAYEVMERIEDPEIQALHVMEG